jgi:hypothetical protein
VNTASDAGEGPGVVDVDPAGPPAGSRPGPLRRLAVAVGTDPLDVVPRLLPLVVLVELSGPAMVVGAMVYALVVVVPAVYRSPWTWFALAAFHLLPLVVEWQGVDNHRWLVGYALLVVGTSFLTADPRRALADQGRWLIGVVFLLAVAWKVGSGEYVDGSFFHHALLTDPRFEPVAELFGLTTEQAAANEALVADLRGGGPGGTLADTSGIRVAAQVMTWWGLLLELAVAATFLLPRPTALRRWAPATLLLFIVTTYAVVPVATFGFVLLVLAYPGLPDRPAVRRTWAATLAFVVLWSPVWRLLTDVDA